MKILGILESIFAETRCDLVQSEKWGNFWGTSWPTFAQTKWNVVQAKMGKV